MQIIPLCQRQLLRCWVSTIPCIITSVSLLCKLIAFLNLHCAMRVTWRPVYISKLYGSTSCTSKACSIIRSARLLKNVPCPNYASYNCLSCLVVVVTYIRCDKSMWICLVILVKYMNMYSNHRSSVFKILCSVVCAHYSNEHLQNCSCCCCTVLAVDVFEDLHINI